MESQGPPKEIKKILEARNVAVSKLRFAHTNFPQIFKALDKIINLGKHFSKNKKIIVSKILSFPCVFTCRSIYSTNYLN